MTQEQPAGETPRWVRDFAIAAGPITGPDGSAPGASSC